MRKLLTISGLLTLMACGSADARVPTDKESKQINAAIRGYEQALRKGAGKRACSVMTPRFQRVLVKQAQDAYTGISKRCPRAIWQLVHQRGYGAEASRERKINVQCVKVRSGKRVCRRVAVNAQSKTGPVYIQLVRREGRWLIYYYRG